MAARNPGDRFAVGDVLFGEDAVCERVGVVGLENGDGALQDDGAVVGALGAAVVRVEVSYGDPVRQEYRDLWIVRLAGDGRCASFEEWPFWPEQPDHAPGREPRG